MDFATLHSLAQAYPVAAIGGVAMIWGAFLWVIR